MAAPREAEGLEERLAETSRLLAEAVEQQAATSQILAAIGRSGHELEPVFQTVLESAIRLCDADGALVWRLDGDVFRVAATSHVTTEWREYFADRTVSARDPGALVGRVSLGAQPVHIPDVLADRDYTWLDAQAAGDYRTMLGVPILASTGVVGVLVVQRADVRPFSPREIEVMSAFAAQGAIAIENVRLFGELDEKRRQLEIASRHKSEFLASMSHELRTPLNAVIGFSDVLLQRMFGDLNEKQDEYIRDIRDSGRHLLELLNEILDLSKVEAGRMELERSMIQLPMLIEHGLTMVRERAAAHRIAIRVQVGDDVGSVYADELRMTQVVLNLLTNAVKFTDDGGTITVLATRVGDFVEVAVRDTGVGIPAGDQERIFDAFQQGSRDGLAGEEGTGLGLTLSKRIVELHGGSIHLASTTGEGSTFTVSIPIGRPDDESLTATNRSGAVSVGPAGSEQPTVLVVEDDPRSLELLRLYLESDEYRVVAARDGDAAIKLAEETAPAAIVLDILLPNRDGWQVLAQLKQDPVTAAIPVIIASMLDEKGRGFALGAADYLVKPISQADVLAAVRRFVRRETRDATVVAIDDDPGARALIHAILEPEGYIVLSADNAEAGIELVHNHRPAIVLIDLLMPGVDGFEAIDRLRASPATKDIPILVLTAKEMTSADRERLRGQIAFSAGKGDLDAASLAGLVRSLAAMDDTTARVT